jgi:hypothetical protein
MMWFFQNSSYPGEASFSVQSAIWDPVASVSPLYDMLQSVMTLVMSV